MGFFDEDNTATTAVHRAGDGYCPVCHKYDKVVLRVYLRNPDTNEHTEVCFKNVCLSCNKKKGRLVSLFTWDGGKIDFSCRYAKLPRGIYFESVRKAVENAPLQNCFTLGEIRQYQR